MIYFGEVDLLCAMQERIGRRGGGKETAILFLSGMEGGQSDVVVCRLFVFSSDRLPYIAVCEARRLLRPIYRLYAFRKGMDAV